MLDLAWPVTRPLLFSLDAERAHTWTLKALSVAPRMWAELAGVTMGPPHPSLSVRVGPLTLTGPIGLAAGLDKDGLAIPFWPSLGFGFIEVGTVTAHAQPGNPTPRMYRYPEQGALINRMGFNNQGSAALADRVRALRDAGTWPTVPVGANIGKSKVTPLESAHEDYATSAKRLRGLVDWLTVNVSSPNTPGLRSLQDSSMLERLLPAVLEAADGTPVLLKLAPDLSDRAIDESVRMARSAGVVGIIATNTTISRPSAGPGTTESGGLSGRPLWPLAREKIRRVLQAADGMPVIGVGGIDCAERAQELLSLGCRAVQLYSAMVFRGPGLVTRLNRSLTR